VSRCPFLAVLLCGVLSADGLSTNEKRGREIYRRGTSEGTARIGSDGVPMPGRLFACASCHGIWGEGSRESGIDVPALSWWRLSSAAVSPLTGRRRIAYNAQSLRWAIADGLDPSSLKLHAGMPRFSMPPEQLDALIAYLARIGDDDDLDPGVTASTIRVGAALPLTGPLESAGRSIRETLEALFARDGLLYGRRIELVAEDSSQPGGTAEATRRLIAGGRVFALVANLGTDHVGALIENEGIPLIGPIAISPHEKGVPNRYTFYLLPDLYDQARAVIDFLATRDAPRLPRLAALCPGSDLDALGGMRAQAKLRGLELLENQSALAAILPAHPDYLLFCGDGAGLLRVSRELEQASLRPSLIAFLSIAQSGIRALPAPIAESALFVAPAFPPDRLHAPEFFSILGNDSTYPGFRAAAFAAGTVLIDALRASGARFSRESLVRILERPQGFQTGVTAPLRFSVNRRVGSEGAVVLALDPSGRELIPVSEWISPKDAP